MTVFLGGGPENRPVFWQRVILFSSVLIRLNVRRVRVIILPSRRLIVRVTFTRVTPLLFPGSSPVSVLGTGLVVRGIHLGRFVVEDPSTFSLAPGLGRLPPDRWRNL